MSKRMLLWRMVLLQQSTSGTQLPLWVRQPTLSGYNSASLIDKILQFKNLAATVCANDEVCSRIRAGDGMGSSLLSSRETHITKISNTIIMFDLGRWLAQIILLMRAKLNNQIPKLKMVLYAAVSWFLPLEKENNSATKLIDHCSLGRSHCSFSDEAAGLPG